METSLLGHSIDHYWIEGLLGGGGGGDVYRARDKRTQALVALKLISDQSSLQRQAERERFFHEITTLHRLNHPHIIKIFDHNMDSPYGPYYVMEYLKGENLQELILREGRMTILQVYSICRQLSEVLGAIHHVGMVYRDLKPCNVFIVQNAHHKFVKLLDFGLVLCPDSKRHTREGFVIGSPRTLSPEQILTPKEVTYRSDIYSFGILLYYLLTMQYPYDGEGKMEIMRQHCVAEPALEHASLSCDMRVLLNQLLAKNAEERPDSMSAVWKLLEDVLLEDMEC